MSSAAADEGEDNKSGEWYWGSFSYDLYISIIILLPPPRQSNS